MLRSTHEASWCCWSCQSGSEGLFDGCQHLQVKSKDMVFIFCQHHSMFHAAVYFIFDIFNPTWFTCDLLSRVDRGQNTYIGPC